MKILALSFIITATSFLTLSSNDLHPSNVTGPPHKIQARKNPFGALIAKADNQNINVEKSILIAKDLGIPYVRTRIWLKEWNGRNAACEEIARAGLQIILNINWEAPMGGGVAYPTDMVEYRKRVTEVLTRYKPALVTIENEEDNPLYHKGTAEDYIAELKTGAEVAHQMGLKVTNGGLTSTLMCMMIWDDYTKAGKTEIAASFANKTFPNARIPNLPHIVQNNAKMDFAAKVMAGIKTMDLDYVNFHWYAPIRGLKGQDISEKMDASVLDDITAYLKKMTGKPVITTEIGQLNPSPDIVKNLMQKTYDLNMDFVIWYSADGGEGKAIALQNGNGTLRPNGELFKGFIQQHFK